MPNAQFGLIDEAGHFMPIEQPEQTAVRICNWLKAEFLQ